MGYKYNDVAIFVETQQKQAGKPAQRPSAWVHATRLAFLEKLEGDPGYRDQLNTWLAQMESAEVPF